MCKGGSVAPASATSAPRAAAAAGSAKGKKRNKKARTEASAEQPARQPAATGQQQQPRQEQGSESEPEPVQAPAAGVQGKSSQRRQGKGKQSLAATADAAAPAASAAPAAPAAPAATASKKKKQKKAAAPAAASPAAPAAPAGKPVRGRSACRCARQSTPRSPCPAQDADAKKKRRRNKKGEGKKQAPEETTSAVRGARARCFAVRHLTHAVGAGHAQHGGRGVGAGDAQEAAVQQEEGRCWCPWSCHASQVHLMRPARLPNPAGAAAPCSVLQTQAPSLLCARLSLSECSARAARLCMKRGAWHTLQGCALSAAHPKPTLSRTPYNTPQAHRPCQRSAPCPSFTRLARAPCPLRRQQHAAGSACTHP